MSKDDGLGVARGTVRLVPYDPQWVALFEEEKALLYRLYGDKILAVEHIGSTSIPGMPSKSIIDIVVAIPSLDQALKYIPPLVENGYAVMPERRFADRFFLPKGPKKDARIT